MSPLVESLDVVAASQESVSRLQFTTQQVQEVTGKVAPPVVDLAHYNVSGPLGISRGNVKVREGEKCAQSSDFHVCTKQVVVPACADLRKTDSHIP